MDGDAPQPLVDALIALMPWAVWTLSRAVRCKQWDIARELIDAQRKPAPRRAQCKRRHDFSTDSSYGSYIQAQLTKGVRHVYVLSLTTVPF
eukprot:COSAG01_NODE_997_length_12228_cov_10.713991_2_plen_91_part_00